MWHLAARCALPDGDYKTVGLPEVPPGGLDWFCLAQPQAPSGDNPADYDLRVCCV